MPPLALIFLLVVLVGTATRLWLAQRQIAAVTRHRAQVPEPFAQAIAPADHHKAADYTVARTRLGRIDTVLDALVVLYLTLGGGVQTLDQLVQRRVPSEPWHGALVILSVLLLVAVIGLPLSLWSTFKLEAKFGFNRTTLALFAMDRLKGLLLALLIGGPLLLAALTLMHHAGSLWWLYVWGLWLCVSLLLTWAYPALIAPAVQSLQPVGRRGAADPHRGLAGSLRLCFPGRVCDRWLPALRAWQCVLHRHRSRQAHRVLRHLARHA